MKPKLRTSFLIIGSLFVLTTIERAFSSFSTKVEPTELVQNEALKAGFFLTLVKGKPLNFISEKFKPNRNLYFYFKNPEASYKGHYLLWYLNEELIKTQPCIKKESCLGSMNPKLLTPGLLSVDIFNDKTFIGSKSIEIISTEISNF